MKSVRQFLCSMVALLVCVACDERSTAPIPTSLNDIDVSLGGAGSDPGAVLVILSGPDIAQIDTAASGYRIYSLSESPTHTRVLMMGNIVKGKLFTVHLKAAHRLSDYSALIEQIANRDGSLVSAGASYLVMLNGPSK